MLQDLLGISSELLLCAFPSSFLLHRCWAAPVAAPVAVGPGFVGTGGEQVPVSSQVFSVFIFCHVACPLAGQAVRHHVLACCSCSRAAFRCGCTPSSKVFETATDGFCTASETKCAAVRPPGKRYRRTILVRGSTTVKSHSLQ